MALVAVTQRALFWYIEKPLHLYVYGICTSLIRSNLKKEKNDLIFFYIKYQDCLKIVELTKMNSAKTQTF